MSIETDEKLKEMRRHDCGGLRPCRGKKLSLIASCSIYRWAAQAAFVLSDTTRLCLAYVTSQLSLPNVIEN